MKIFTLPLFLVFVYTTQAQVGVGTTNPSGNSVLDVSSTNKGLMLPRINDTSSVSNPSAGLVIYNKNLNALAFHNGTSWRTVAATSTMDLPTDSLTYQSSGPGTPGVTAGQFKAYGIGTASGMPRPGATELDVIFAKYPDANSTYMQQCILGDTPQGTLELNYYRAGSGTPYKSLKFTNVRFTTLSLGLSEGTPATENYTLRSTTYAFKDWVNNKFFTYNFMTKVLTNAY